MIVATVSKGSTSGLPQSLITAQAAIHLPEVQQMLPFETVATIMLFSCLDVVDPFKVAGSKAKCTFSSQHHARYRDRANMKGTSFCPVRDWLVVLRRQKLQAWALRHWHWRPGQLS